MCHTLAVTVTGGIKVNSTNGRIAEDSRKKICAALLRLMNIYDYREITVTQLAQEAELSRKTYYRLFADKDEVLRGLFDGLYSECLTVLIERDIKRYWDLVQIYFDFWESRKELLLILKKNGLLPRLFAYVYGKAYGNVGSIFSIVRSPEKESELSAFLPYLIAYSIGGMNGMLTKWAESGMEIPSSVLIAQLKAGFNSPEL